LDLPDQYHLSATGNLWYNLLTDHLDIQSFVFHNPDEASVNLTGRLIDPDYKREREEAYLKFLEEDQRIRDERFREMR